MVPGILPRQLEILSMWPNLFRNLLRITILTWHPQASYIMAEQSCGS